MGGERRREDEGRYKGVGGGKSKVERGGKGGDMENSKRAL